MYANNGKISSRQTFRLYVFDLIGISTLLLPSFLAKLSGSDGIFAIVIGCALGYVYLRYLGFVMGKMNTDMETYLEQDTPKWVKKICELFLLFYCCVTAGFGTYVFCNLMQYSLIKEVNYLLVLLVTVIVAAYSVSGGIEVRARVYEVLFWFILVPYVIMMLMSIKDFEITYVNHFMESNVMDMGKSIYLVFLLLTPLFFSLSLIRKKENKQDVRNMIKPVTWALFLTFAILLGSYVLLLGNFGGKSLASMSFPVITLMSTIQIKGNFLKRMDALMLGVWFFTLFALLNLHMHYGAVMLKKLSERHINGDTQANGNTLKMSGKDDAGTSDNYITVRKSSPGQLILVAVITLLVAWFLKYFQGGIMWFLNYYSYVAVPFMVIVPGLLVLGKKRRKQTATLLLLLAAGSLTGCKSTELENRCFPMMVAVDYDEANGQVLFYESFPETSGEEKAGESNSEVEIPMESGNDFAESKLNYEMDLNKVVDYNHLKVIVLGEKLLENGSAYEDMLFALAESESFPRNTYVCVVKDVEEFIKIKEDLPQEMGTYLEEYLENHEDEDIQLTSLGDLIDEVYNKELTLFLPFLEGKDSHAQGDGYYVINEGVVEGVKEESVVRERYMKEKQIVGSQIEENQISENKILAE